MRRLLVFLLALILALPMVANSESATATLQEMYAQAELLMVQGDYTGAAAKFEALGAYSDASQMTMYCKAIAAAETLGLYSMAVDAFNDLGDFKDSKQMAKYYEGRAYEASGNIDLTTASDAALEQSIWSYEEAEKIYGGLAFFKDSLTRMAACSERIKEIKSEQNSRAEAKKEATYQNALALEQSGDYAGAIKLYQTIKGYKDSNDRMSICQTAINEGIYQNALALEQSGDYAGAIKVYQTIMSYKDSLIRIEDCEKILAEQKLEADYQKAMSFFREEKHPEAMRLFVELGDYKESVMYASECAQHAHVMYVTNNSYSTQISGKALGELTASYIIKYTYANDRLVFSKKEHDTFPVETTYSYNEEGMLSSSVESGINSRSGSSITSTYELISTYNHRGDIISEDYKLTNVTQQKVVNHRQTNREYTYDENGNRLTEKGGNALSNTEYSYTYEYEYSEGIKMKVTCFSNGKLNAETTYEYDQFGRLLKELTLWYHYDGKTHYTELLYSYEY